MNMECLHRKNVKGEIVGVSERYLRMAEVMNLVGITKATIYKLIINFEFPSSYAVSESCVAWLESDITEWKRLGPKSFYLVYGEQLKAAKAQTDKAA
jgi:prophage regulatory protein